MTTDANGNNHQASGVPTGGQFTTKDRADSGDLDAPVAEEYKPFITFCSDSDGTTRTTDIGPALLLAGEEWYQLLTEDPDRINEYFNTFPENLPEGISEDSTIDCSAALLGAWLRKNRPWPNDGITPHPTGGYVLRRAISKNVVECMDADFRFHRLDGPAVHSIDSRGVRSIHYFVHGALTRPGGLPAVESSDGSKQWWSLGVQTAALDPNGKLTLYDKKGHPLP